MTDRMTPIPFGKLMDQILSGDVFGLKRLYRATSQRYIPVFGGKIETPFGPAAGPHTQLAQNIMTAYAAGARFFELKTVQTLDGEDLPVAKPCINAYDECYNVEWSTELTVEDALDEYVKAWYALKLISKELGLGSPEGFVFNMSVGYDLAGIKSPKIDRFIEGLKDARELPIWHECEEWAKKNMGRLEYVSGDPEYVGKIDSHICRSITLSTLHGCPPDEIERIATYLIGEKHLHTFIKCNPTLLGYDWARRTADEMGYDYVSFDEHHFNEDLQFTDAIPMITRLKALAKKNGLEFGVKLTNTFPVDIKAGELPGDEMYMSGRSLFPMSMEVARRISEAFDGDIRISYSGGADFYNIRDIFSCGIYPVTMATTLLKCGGYQRLTQIAESFGSISYDVTGHTDVAAVSYLARTSHSDDHYLKPTKAIPSRKNGKPVPLIDCFTAPCSSGCPIGQDIPEYIRLAGEGKYEDAMNVILDRNPLPFITGTICPHTCADKCRRSFYDESIKIREVKLVAAKSAAGDILEKLAPVPPRTGSKVAIIGGGAAGIAAAFFLLRSGVPCTIFEKSEKLGGVVRYVIPDFRISNDAIDRDIAFIEKLGADIRTNTEIDDIASLAKEGYDYVIIANGAWIEGHLDIDGAAPKGAVEFLADFKNGKKDGYGENIAVIGGGNTAMDAARAARRLPGVKNVYIVYRRDRRNMPADEEELDLAEQDGVLFRPLLLPESYKDGRLICQRMELGAPDASGRRKPMITGSVEKIEVSSIITAVGEHIDTEFLEKNGVTVENGEVTKAAGPFKGVYAAGDGATGAATVVKAVAGARKATDAILKALGIEYISDYNEGDRNLWNASAKKGVLACAGEMKSESMRCLECDLICENCVDVCPNRANVSINTPFGKQIVHVDRMCNECGNCSVFCPFDSDPYKDKLTLFHTEREFDGSTNAGFFFKDGLVKLRIGDVTETVKTSDIKDEHIREVVEAVEKDHSYLI